MNFGPHRTNRAFETFAVKSSVHRAGLPDRSEAQACAASLCRGLAVADSRFALGGPQHRAFDSASGKQLWSDYLPFSGIATPMTYLGADGRQYVVIAAGGHSGLSRTYGDTLVAYALPARDAPK